MTITRCLVISAKIAMRNRHCRLPAMEIKKTEIIWSRLYRPPVRRTQIKLRMVMNWDFWLKRYFELLSNYIYYDSDWSLVEYVKIIACPKNVNEFKSDVKKNKAKKKNKSIEMLIDVLPSTRQMLIFWNFKKPVDNVK